MRELTQEQIEIIRKNPDKVGWDYWVWVSQYCKLSEEFIREFSDKVYWTYISCSQELSEDFIREFAYKVNWYYIFRFQKLSDEFMLEFQDKTH